MLAPYLGVSIYTWTSIIGVILAGISLGAYIGGKIADRFPLRKTLDIILLVSGIMVLLIVPITDHAMTYDIPLPFMAMILLVTAIIFFIPACVLGTISPVAVRLTLKNLSRTGDTIGKMYAFSTLGAIAGTFAAGFFLVGTVDMRAIIFFTGVLLILMAALTGGLLRPMKVLIVFLIAAIPSLFVLYMLVYSVSPFPGAHLYKESAYYTILVNKETSEDGETPVLSMALDYLVHAYIVPSDPFHMEYEYEQVYDEVLRWRFKKTTPFKSLSIGGGGYVFPRYMELRYPEAQIDVVEIDPEVTKIAYKLQEMDKGTRIRSYNTDGRWFVMNCSEKYDLILTDAFNDLSIPYHLTTKEFAQQIKNILNPGGIVMTNIIDKLLEGSFLPSYIRTLREVFGGKNVHLISTEPNFKRKKRSTFIVLASTGNVDMKSFEVYAKAKWKDDVTSVVVPETLVNDMVRNRRSVVITDDYAPVDNLIAPVFKERFSDTKSKGKP